MIQKLFGLNPRRRMVSHIEYMEENIKITTKQDQEHYESVKKGFLQTAKKLKRYQASRIVIFILLYISAFGAIAQGLEVSFLTEFLAPVAEIASLLGASILTLIFLAQNYLIRMLLFDLVTEHGHLIAILVKNNVGFTPHPDYDYHLLKSYKDSE